ncbi:MAG: vWA domain-containing protein, partial [Blastocatellia bacterium]
VCIVCAVEFPASDARLRQPPAVGDGETTRRPNSERIAGDFARRETQAERVRRADIMFVLDCTKSMSGEINAIRDTIIAFTETIRSEGVRARVGLIEFRDRRINEDHRVLLFDGQVFTGDPEAFRREVSTLRAAGGGDEPESSLDALMLALRQPFDPTGSKVIVLITDAPPHVPDLETQSVEETVDAISHAGINQFYVVTKLRKKQNEVYTQMLGSLRNQGVERAVAFNLGDGDDFSARAEDFKGVLMNLVKPITQGTR